MKKHTHARILAAAALSLSLLVPALASAIPVTYSTVDPGLSIWVTHATPGTTGGSTTVNALTGVYQINVTEDGNTTTYKSFCIDVFEDAPRSTIDTYEWETNLGGNLFSDQAVTDINKLWTNYFEVGWDDPGESNIKAAALQLAIWEITTEDILNNKDTNSYNYDLKEGGFMALLSNNSDLDDQAINQAASWLSTENLNGLTATSSLIALTDDGSQDYITATAPVPEPATMLLFGTGLVGTAFIRRRRKTTNG